MTPIQQIKAAIRVDEYAARYLTIKNGKSLCCFHVERTPSLSLHEHYFYCHGCSIGGDLIKFAAEYHAITVSDSVRMFASELGIPLKRQPAAHPYDAAKDARIRAEADEWRRQMKAALIAALHTDKYDLVLPFLERLESMSPSLVTKAYREQRTLEQASLLRESIRESDLWVKAMTPPISGLIDRMASAPDDQFPDWQYGERMWVL